MIISSFIIQANVITIVNYDCKTFVVQATKQDMVRLMLQIYLKDHFLPLSLIKSHRKIQNLIIKKRTIAAYHYLPKYNK
jgi:hypothetical protein